MLRQYAFEHMLQDSTLEVSGGLRDQNEHQKSSSVIGLLLVPITVRINYNPCNKCNYQLQLWGKHTDVSSGVHDPGYMLV